MEYILIDGASTDGTQEIIKKYNKDIDVFISEKDTGIFNAMNKGIQQATGDVLAILNSDDYYTNPYVVETMINFMEKENLDAAYGDLVIFSETPKRKKILRRWKSKQLTEKDWEKGLHPAHPTFFVRKEVYEQYGMFNEKYRIASDYDLMLRFLYIHKIKHAHLITKEPLVSMRAGGNSNQSLKAIIKSNQEVHLSWIENQLKPPKLLIVGKIFSKIKQFFR